MTREEFIKKLEESRYSYEIQGNKIVVTGKGNVYLGSLTSLPPGVEFRNGGYVDLSSLTSLPSGVVFRNGGHVNLRELTSLPPGVVFENGGSYGGSVFFELLIGGWLVDWNGNIEGIDSKRLLNVMIKRGMFI